MTTLTQESSGSGWFYHIWFLLMLGIYFAYDRFASSMFPFHAFLPYLNTLVPWRSVKLIIQNFCYISLLGVSLHPLLPFLGAVPFHPIEQADVKGKQPHIVTADFKRFQRNYMFVYLCMMMADWLQGPYVYALYHVRLRHCLLLSLLRPSLILPKYIYCSFTLHRIQNI